MANTGTAADAGVVAVGSDLTDGARIAVARAAEIAKATGSPLLVVHVVPETAILPVAPLPGDWSAKVASATTFEGRAALFAAARLATDAITRELGLPDAEAVVVTGRPHEALPVVAQRRGARLLVLGVHAPLDPFESFFLGSTTERALRVGTTPVLLARRRAAKPYRRVLVPVDLGDVSMPVLRCVARNFPDAACDVVHFLAPLRSDAVTARERRIGYEASLASLAVGAGLDARRTRVRTFVAEPRRGILAEVRARRPDLIVMGTHARTGVARVLLGSVADYVLHAAAGVDVLVVPPGR